MPEPNADAKLWFLAETRKLKGAAEAAVFGAEKESGGKVEAYTLRPAVIVGEKPGWVEWVHGKMAPSVGVRELAAVMVDVGVGGGGKGEGEGTGRAERALEVGAIKARGRELLRVGGKGSD